MATTAMMIEALVAMRHDERGVPVDHFWQLVERFRADLVNQAVAILGDRQDAEDVAQDSLCRAFRCLSQLRDPQKLGSWLRNINRNNAADTYSTNYGISRDVWDRNEQQNLSAFDRNYKGAYDEFDFNEFRPSMATFDDLFRRYKAGLDAYSGLD